MYLGLLFAGHMIQSFLSVADQKYFCVSTCMYSHVASIAPLYILGIVPSIDQLLGMRIRCRNDLAMHTRVHTALSSSTDEHMAIAIPV